MQLCIYITLTCLCEQHGKPNIMKEIVGVKRVYIFFYLVGFRLAILCAIIRMYSINENLVRAIQQLYGKYAVYVTGNIHDWLRTVLVDYVGNVVNEGRKVTNLGFTDDTDGLTGKGTEYKALMQYHIEWKSLPKGVLTTEKKSEMIWTCLSFIKSCHGNRPANCK